MADLQQETCGSIAELEDFLSETRETVDVRQEIERERLVSDIRE